MVENYNQKLPTQLNYASTGNSCFRNLEIPEVRMYEITLNGRYFGVISELDMFTLKHKVEKLHQDTFCLATYRHSNGNFLFSGYSILNSSLNVVMEANCLNG